MSSTATNDSSLIQRAMDRPITEKAALKSVRIKQATEAILATDAAAGLAENRRSTKHYNLQTDRVVKHKVDQYIQGSGGPTVPKEDDETVITDLGDRYNEIHHHHGSQGSGVGKLAKAIAPWLLAMTMGPAGALIATWMMGDKPDDAVNIKDVQSKLLQELYMDDGSGNMIKVPVQPYKQATP